MQIVLPVEEMPVEVTVIHPINRSNPKKEIQDWLSVRHDLTVSSFSFGVIEERNQIGLLMNIHHIATDGVTCEILANDIGRFLSESAQTPSSEVASCYLDYVACYYNEGVQKEQSRFWKNYLSKVPSQPLDLVVGNQRSPPTSSLCHREEILITEKELEKLNSQSGRLFSTLLAALAVVVAKFSCEERFVLGFISQN